MEGLGCREKAIALCLDQGQAVPEVAGQLGVAPSTLRGWLRQARLEREVEALRQELARLQQGNLVNDKRPLIRTVHHLACTGGTVISKCLAAMPQVAVLSELNPLNRYGRTFEPTNPLLLLERSHRPLTLEEIKEDFLSRIGQSMRICEKDGMALVVRDHSHTDFCLGEAPGSCTPICDFLSEGHDLVSVVTVRHPLDSYLGLLEKGWQNQFRPSTLDEYCRRTLAFLNRYRELPLLRYEAFCAQPQGFMEELCGILQLDYRADFVERFGAIRLSGNSGRVSTTAIAPRPRRPIPEAVQLELVGSAS
ncbi:MAG: transposase [Cyanobium sp. CZS 48M]|nr:transposase [Cyanobium sp. CZS48M]